MAIKGDPGQRTPEQNPAYRPAHRHLASDRSITNVSNPAVEVEQVMDTVVGETSGEFENRALATSAADADSLAS